MHISIRVSFIKLKIHNGAVKGKVHSNIACQWRLEGCLESVSVSALMFKRSCFYVKIACHNIPKPKWIQLSGSPNVPSLHFSQSSASWKKELPGVCFFLLPSTTGHIGELFADGHMLCSRLLKMPQATFGEAHCTGPTENSKSNGCWSQPLARWHKADDSLHMRLSLPVPCPYLSTSSFVFHFYFFF